MRRSQEHIDYIHDRLSYDVHTGLVIWKKPNSRSLTSGQPAGCKNSEKRIQIKINGYKYLVTHIIWVIMYNRFPDEGKVIDHIDRNPLNNKWYNLREVSYSTNIMNSSYRDGKGKKYYELYAKGGITWNQLSSLHNLKDCGAFPTAKKYAESMSLPWPPRLSSGE